MNENVVLIGAGSAVFTKGLVSDLLRQGWEGELRLVDIDPKALAVAEKLAAKMLAARKSCVKLSAAVDRRDVLPGATAVVCTIGVGGRRAWEQDVFVPRQYGIYQPVGDSVMPGGSSRALRMIPAMVAIAEDVLDLCPGALFFNYGNPMGQVCRAVRKATGAEMVGLCHGVFSVAYELADRLGVPRDRLAYTALGMNHLTWFTELSMDGADLMPRLLAMADGRPDSRERGECFIWELTRLFRAYPAVGDRHTTEFFPRIFSAKGSYYGLTPGVEAFNGCWQEEDPNLPVWKTEILGARVPPRHICHLIFPSKQTKDSRLWQSENAYERNWPNAASVEASVGRFQLSGSTALMLCVSRTLRELTRAPDGSPHHSDSRPPGRPPWRGSALAGTSLPA